MASAPKPALEARARAFAAEAREGDDGHDGNEWMCEKRCGYSGTYSDVEAHETTCDGKPSVEPPVEPPVEPSVERVPRCRSVYAQVYHQVMKRIGPQVDALEVIIGRLHRKLGRQDRELDRQAREITRLKRRLGERGRRVRGGIKKGNATSKQKKKQQRELLRMNKMLANTDNKKWKQAYYEKKDPCQHAWYAYANLVPGARKVTTPTFE